MSLLDPQALQELTARVQSGNATETQPVQEPAQSEPQQDVKQEDSSPSQAQEREEKLVPYDRFKQVNDTKKEYKRKFDEQQRELERLRKELEGRGSKSEDDKWLDDLFSADDKPSKSDPLKDLDSRLRAFEMQQSEQLLDKIVDSAIKNNRDVDAEIVESVVYHVISDNPDADLEDINEMIANIKSMTTRFNGNSVNSEANKKPAETKPKLEAPARLSMTGTKTPSTDNNSKPIRSVQEGSQKLLDFLRNNKIY